MSLSMTGFGTSTVTEKNISVKCEVLCLNKKNIDINISLPKYCIFAEIPLRKAIQNKLHRGKITILFDIKLKSNKKKIEFNEDLFRSWQKILNKLSKNHNLTKDISLTNWLSIQEIWDIKEETISPQSLLPLLEKSLESSLTNVIKMRKTEGKHLIKDIALKLKSISTKIIQIEKYSPQMLINYKKKLSSQVKTSKNFTKSENDIFNRFINTFSDKTDIAEELTRLKSHINQFKNFIKGNSPIGRSLDFLLQEMLREINTIASKSTHLKISQITVDMKTLIEQVREQSMNIL